MHLYGNGCPKCSYSISKAELEIVQYIKSLGIDEQDIQMSYRLENKQIDIYLKKYNLAIEYNGTMFHHSSNSEYVSDLHPRLKLILITTMINGNFALMMALFL